MGCLEVVDTKAIVLLYEDGKVDSERVLFKGLKSELVALIGNESVLKESGGIFNFLVDGDHIELRIEKATLDFEKSDNSKYVFYQVVPNKLNTVEIGL